MFNNDVAEYRCCVRRHLKFSHVINIGTYNIRSGCCAKRIAVSSTSRIHVHFRFSCRTFVGNTCFEYVCIK